jgi:hypothetical protein
MAETVKQITHYILSRYMDGGSNKNRDPQTGSAGLSVMSVTPS